MYANFFDPAKYSKNELDIIEKLLVFNGAEYLSANADIKEAGVDPLKHFLALGMYENRLPWSVPAMLGPMCSSPSLFGEKQTITKIIGFDASFYQRRYPDVTGDPFMHFLQCGMGERRLPFDFFDHLESEKIAWATARKYELSNSDSLDRQLRIKIDDPVTFVSTLIDSVVRSKVSPKAYRNNFWLVLGMGLTALEYYGAASICYSYFYNYFLPLPLLNNWQEKMYVTGKVHLTVDYARSQNWQVRPLSTAPTTTIPDPVFLNRPNPIAAQDTKNPMPRSHYCVLQNVIAFGLNGMILSGSHDLLYDYLELDKQERPTEIKGPNVLHIINQSCTYSYVYTDIEIPEAFSLLHDHSHNYFHWLIEVLPRYLLARKNGLALNVPLLIDEKLSPLLISLLESIVEDPTLLIKVPRGHSVRVTKLHWVSDLSCNTVHTDDHPLKNDILLSPDAFTLLREIAAPHFVENATAYERVLITRSNVLFRRLVNRHLFRSKMTEYDFWSFDPGQVPFEEQVRVFSNAKIVIGEAGAALANLVFCRPGTTVVILVNGFKNSNYYYLAQMGFSLGIKLVFFECFRLDGTHHLGVHDDMIVNIQELEKHIRILTTDISDQSAKKLTQNADANKKKGRKAISDFIAAE